MILCSICVSSIVSCGFDPAAVFVSVGSLAVLSFVILLLPLLFDLAVAFCRSAPHRSLFIDALLLPPHHTDILAIVSGAASPAATFSLAFPSMKLFLSLSIMLQCQSHSPRWWSLMQPLVSCILYSFDVLSQFALNSLVFVLLDAAKVDFQVGRPRHSPLLSCHSSCFVFSPKCNLTVSLSSHSSEMELLVLAHVLYIFGVLSTCVPTLAPQVTMFLHHIDRRCRKFHR